MIKQETSGLRKVQTRGDKMKKMINNVRDFKYNFIPIHVSHTLCYTTLIIVGQLSCFQKTHTHYPC